MYRIGDIAESKHTGNQYRVIADHGSPTGRPIYCFECLSNGKHMIAFGDNFRPILQGPDEIEEMFS